MQDSIFYDHVCHSSSLYDNEDFSSLLGEPLVQPVQPIIELDLDGVEFEEEVLFDGTKIQDYNNLHDSEERLSSSTRTASHNTCDSSENNAGPAGSDDDLSEHKYYKFDNYKK